MTKWRKYNINHSFAAKICFWVALGITGVFMRTCTSTSHETRKIMLENANKKANLELDKAILFIDTELEAVEIAGENLVAFLDKQHRMAPETAYSICSDFLNTNVNIQGVALCFESDLYPAYAKGFAPYVIQDFKSGKQTRMNLADRYAYERRYWYKEAKRRRGPLWTDPFREANGSIVCSYCIPVYNRENRFMGVVALDFNMEEFTEEVQSIKPYVNSHISILDRNYHFVVHPNPSLIMRQSVKNILDKANFETDKPILADFKAHKRGDCTLVSRQQGDENTKKIIYYAPIKRMGWTVVLSCDKEEITRGVSELVATQSAMYTAFVIVLWILMFMLIWQFLRPILRFARTAQCIAQGDFSVRLPKVHSRDEIYYLGRALQRMQSHLAKYIDELKDINQEKGRIESELNIASQIQMSMIPKIYPPYPDRDDIDIYGMLKPAKAVGGDLYDFYLRDEKLFFCIGDVSGKGVPASLVMAVTRSLLRMVSAQESNPDRIVTSINSSMSDMNDSNMFVTLFAGVLDLPTGRLRYCNAGHNAPVLIDSNTGKVTMLDVKPNLPIAVVPDIKFEGQEVVITPGTAIFLYTDGLTEAENADKELFDEDRMTAQLAKSTCADSRGIIEGMLEAVHQHVQDAEQSDDLTMVAIRYMRRKQENKYYSKLTLHNDIAETPKIAEFMDAVAEEATLKPALTCSLNLAIEEAVVNVMNYAYPKDHIGLIKLEAFVNDVRMKFVITDSGEPFDPTTKAEPDTNAALDDRPIGGLGIFLVRQIMDTVNYERIDGQNILTLRKNF